MGLVSLLSLANHSDSASFLVAHTSISQDGCQREGFWEVVGHVVSPFDFSRTLPVGGGLSVLCSLPGPPVLKQLMQMVTMVPGQGGRLQSVCFPQQTEQPGGLQSMQWQRGAHDLVTEQKQQNIYLKTTCRSEIIISVKPHISPHADVLSDRN